MSISRKFQRSKSKYTLSQKIISAVTAAGFIMQPFTAFAGEIIKPGGTNLINNNVANIWADKVVGNAAVNVFDKFNLSANEIANMYFSTEANKNAIKDNLVNFVNSRIDINGTVNAVKDNKIGGNLFFLSKDGMAVGKSGVINTGSLYVMTPTQGAMADLQNAIVTNADKDVAEKAANAFVGMETWQAIPVNPLGTITVLGKVNATNNVQMRAAKIGVGKNVSGETIDDVANDGIVKEANIQTGVVNFSDIVNIKNADGSEVITNADLEGVGMTATVDSNSGDIVLAAYTDRSTLISNVEDIPVIETLLGSIEDKGEGTFRPQSFEASVDVYGTVDAAGKADISATAINSNADVDENGNYVNKTNDGVSQLASVNANVNIGGTVEADSDVSVKAEAINRYVDNSGALASGFKLAVSSGTPLAGDVAYSALETKANVNIESGADIKSTGGNVDIDAKAETLAASAASTIGLKFKVLGGYTGANMPAAAVVYTGADNSAAVNVNGSIDAAKNVDINADAKMTVEGENKMTLTGEMANQVGVGVTVVNAENNAAVNIGTENNASIVHADGDLNVKAAAQNDFTSNVSVAVGESSAVGVAVNVTNFDSSADVNVDSSLTSYGNLNIKADNTIEEDNVTAETKVGSGKYMSSAMQVAKANGTVDKIKGFVSGIAQDLGLSLGGNDIKTSLSLGDVLEAGATITVSNQNHNSGVTIGNTANINSGSKLDIGAQTLIKDAHMTATGATYSYNDATSAPIDLNAAVLISNMKNNASVVVEDAETTADGTTQSAQLTGTTGVDVNAGTRFEYNRINNMISKVTDAAAQIENAFKTLDDAFAEDFGENIPAQYNELKDKYTSAYKTFMETLNGVDTSKVNDETLLTTEAGANNVFDAVVDAYNVLTALEDLYALTNNYDSQVMQNAKEVFAGASDIMSGALAFGDPNSYGNFAAVSQSKGSSGDVGGSAPGGGSVVGSVGGQNASAVNGAGSVMVIDVDSASKVEIGSGAKIESYQNVNINAENYMKDVSLGGLNSGVFNNKGGGTAASIGATINYSEFDTDNIILVNDGAEISGGNIDINAENEIDHVSVAASAGKGPSSQTKPSGVVLNGMLSFVNGSSEILTVVDDGAKLTASQNANIPHYTEGVINIKGHNNTSIVNVAAGGSWGHGSAAVGVGLAYNDFDVKNITGVGDAASQIENLYTSVDAEGNAKVDEEKVKELQEQLANEYTKQTAGKDEGGITAYGFNVDAATEGSIQSVSVAGSLSNNDSSGEIGFFDKIGSGLNSIDQSLVGENGLVNKVTSGIFKTDKNGGVNGFFNMGSKSHGTGGNINIVGTTGNVNTYMPSFSIAGSGSVSINMMDNSTQAIVDNAKITMKSTGGEKGDISVTARDASYAGAYSGAAAVKWNSGGKSSDKGVSVSGAAGVNDIDNAVKATIKNSTISNAGKIDTMALSGGEQLALGLGLAVVKADGTSGYSGNAAVSINLIDHDVEALLENNIVSDTDDIDVTAYARDIENTGGGSLSVGQQKVGVGASVGVAQLNNNISAGIKGGSYTNVGSVDVEALNALQNITVGIAAGISLPSGDSASAVVSGAGVYNEVHNTTNAFIEGNSENDKVIITTVDGGNVNVTAQDVAVEVESEYEKAFDGLADGKEEIAERMGDDFDLYGKSEMDSISMEDVDDALNSSDDDGTAAQSNATDGETVTLDKSGGSSIITVSGVLSGTSGKGAGGAAVAITDIENNYTANIDYAQITAEELNAEAGSDSNIVTVSGGIAAASKGAGVGSVTWNDVENTAKANITDSVVNAQTTLAKAVNKAQIVSVAGQISGAGKAGVGATLSYIGLDNSTEANIISTTFDKRDKEETGGITVTADAENSSDSYNVAAGISAGSTAAVSGNVAVTQTHGTSGAVIDDAAINNAKAVAAHAWDDTDILSVIGTVSAAGTASVGAGVAYTEIGSTSTDEVDAQQTVAAIENTDITTAASASGSTVSAQATDSAKVINVAVGIGGAGTAAVQGASATSLVNKTTAANITDTNIDENTKNSKNANIAVEAVNDTEITSSADVAAVAGTGAGVGAGVAVNRIVQNTKAALNGGTMNVNNLTVSADGTPRIENIGIGIGVAGEGAGVTGNVSVNMIENNVTAHIGGGANIVADGSVGVVATSDEQIANYAGSASVAGIGAGAGVSVAVNKIAGTTSATVGGDKEDETKVTAKGKDSLTTDTNIDKTTINDELIDNDTVNINSHIKRTEDGETRNGLIVDASSTRDLKSFLINAGVGGVGAGVTGTVNVNMINGSTEAAIINTEVNSSANKGNVFVNAGDYTNMSGFVGSAGVAGVGGGVGLGSDTNTVTRKVSATVQDAAIYAGDFEVDADSMQGVSSFVVSAGVGGVGAGASGVVTVTKLNNTTKAALLNSTVNANTVNVNAAHTGIVNAGNVGVGASGLGGGLGISVGVLKDDSETIVTVGTEDSTATDDKTTITVSGDVNIGAENTATVNPTISATGVGAVAGVAGATSINNINSRVTTNINNAEINSTGGNISGTAKNNFNVDAYIGGNAVGAVGVGASVTVNTIDSTVQTNVNNSKFNAAKDVTLTAEEARDIYQLATNVALGGVAAGANIAVTTVGQAITDEDVIAKINEANAMYTNSEGNDINSLMAGADDALGAAGITNYTPTIGAETGGAGSAITVNITGSDIDAGDNFNAESKESGSIGMTLGSGAAGAAAVNAGVGILNVNRNVGVNITGGSIEAGTVDIGTDITGEAKLDVYQGSAGVIGANAAVGIVNTTGSSQIKISGAELTGNNINILAADHGVTKANTMGITVGAVSVGVIIAEADNTGATNVVITDTEANAKDSGQESSISIGTDKANTVEAHATGGAGGSAAAQGVVATADDSGVSSITLGKAPVIDSEGNIDDTASITAGNTFTVNNITVQAAAKPVVKAIADSFAVSIFGTAGASVATANAAGTVGVNVYNGNTLAGDDVSISAEAATQDGKNTAEAQVVGNSGSGYYTVANNTATANVTTNVDVNVGDVDYKTTTEQVFVGYEDVEDSSTGERKEVYKDVTTGATNLNVSGSNTAKASANAKGITIGGIFSSGNNQAFTNNKAVTNVTLNSGSEKTLLNSLNVTAAGTSDNTAKADGSGGGFISGDLAAWVKNDSQAQVGVNVSGKLDVEGDIAINALQNDTVNLNADALKATVVGASATLAENNIGGLTNANISSATITGGGKLDVNAANTITFGNTEQYAVEGSGYGGVNVQGAVFTNNITKNTAINLNDADITTLGTQALEAKTTGNINAGGYIKAAGLGAFTWVDVDNNVTASNALNVDANSTLTTKQEGADITLAAVDNMDLTVAGYADVQGAAVGGASSDVTNDLVRNNSVTVSGDLYALNDVNLYAGKDKTGANGSLDLVAESETYNYAALPIADPKLDDKFAQNNQIIINSGSDISSVRDINLYADAGKESVRDTTLMYTWVYSDKKENYSNSSVGDAEPNNKSAQNFVQVNGNLTAGVQNKQYVTIGGESGQLVFLNKDTLNAVNDFYNSDNYAVGKPSISASDGVDKNSIVVGTFDYGTTLFERYNELGELMQSYGEDKNSTAYLGYKAEQDRIKSQLEQMGLIDTWTENGQEYTGVVEGMTVDYIELPDIVASGGNINIQSDTLSGSGSLKAQGSPEVVINNNTNLYMKINNITVGESGGEINFNNNSLTSDNYKEKITGLNADKSKVVNFTKLTADAGNGTGGKLVINGNYGGGTVYAKVNVDDKEQLIQTTPRADIEINGIVNSEGGTVEISSVANNIIIQGETAEDSAAVKGQTVKLSASNGSVSQGFQEGIVSIGGNVQDQYKSQYDSMKNDWDTQYGYDHAENVHEVKYGSAVASQGNMIAGENIYINAADINVNGKIQSGYAEYVVNITKDIQDDINVLQKNWQDSGSQPLTDAMVTTGTAYRIVEGKDILQDDGTYYRQLDVYYNPYTGQIVVPDVDANGGQVYLTGRISSTGSGSIKVLDGAYDINVTNNTGTDLQLGKLISNNVDGLISITDTGKQEITEITRNQTVVKDLSGNVKSTSGSAIDEYNPQSGLRYNWTTGQEVSTSKTYEQTIKAGLWGAVETVNTTDMSKYEQDATVIDSSEGEKDKLNGEYIGTVSGIDNNQDFAVIYDNKVLENTQTGPGEPERWSTGFLGWFKWEKYTWTKKTGTSQQYVASVKADKPISIGFIGNADGNSNIGVTSVGNINLTNNIASASDGIGSLIDINSTGGAINQLGGSLIGDNIDLSAAKGINDVQITSIGDTVNLNAVSSSGDVDVTVNAAYGKAGNVVIGNLFAGTAANPAGDVSLTAYGNITQSGKGTSVSGNRIDLVSANGAIGTDNQEIIVHGGQEIVDATDSLSASVNAQAKGDINLTQDSGDMRIGRVYSDSGDVTITVNSGDLIDALPSGETVDRGDTDELIQKWIDLGLVEGTGDYSEKVEQDVKDYKESVKTEFENYLAQKDYYESQSGSVTQEYKDAYNAYSEAKTQYDSLKSDYDTWTKGKIYYTNDAYVPNRDNYRTDAEYQTALTEYNAGKATFEELNVKFNGSASLGDYVADNTGDTYAAYLNPSVTITDSEGKSQIVDLKAEFDGYANYESLKATYGSYESADAYLAGSEAQTYIAELSDSGKTYWDKDKLLYAISDTITNPDSGSTDNVVKDPNIKGNNITINVSGGSAGLNSEKVTELKVAGIGDDIENLKLLASADASTVNWNNETGIITINEKLPIGIQSTGKVDVVTDGNVYLSGRTESGPDDGQNILNIGNINAGTDGNIRLQGQDGIYNLSASDRAAITGKDLLIQAGEGSIGKDNAMMTTNLSGSMQAQASGGIYINQLGTNNLVLDSVGAGQDIVLKSANDILMSTDMQSGGAVNYIRSDNGTITLEAQNIGAKDNALRILDNGVVVNADATGNNADAAGNIVLEGVSGTGPAGELVLGAIEGANLDVTSAGNVSIGKDASEGEKAVEGSIEVDGDASISAEHGSVTQTADSNIKANAVKASATENILLNSKENSVNSFVVNGLGADNSLNGSVNIVSTAHNAENTVKVDFGKVVGEETVGLTVNGTVDVTSTGTSGLNISGGSLTTSGNNAGNVTFTSAGSITAGTSVNSAADIVMDAKGAVTNTGSLTARNNIDVTTTTGKIDLGGSVTANTGNVNVETDSGRITTTGNVTGGNDVNVTSGSGAINLGGNVDAETGLVNVTTGSGSITTTGNVSGHKDVTLESVNGDITVGGYTESEVENVTANVKGAGNIEFTGEVSASGDVQAKVTGEGDISTGSSASVSGTDITFTTNDGSITTGSNLTADANVNLNTNTGDIILGGDVTASDGNITININEAGNLKDVLNTENTLSAFSQDGDDAKGNIYINIKGIGDVDLSEIYADNDARLDIANGNLALGTINGELVAIQLRTEDKDMNVGEIIAGTQIVLTGSDMTLDQISQRPDADGMLVITPDNAEADKPIDNFTIGDIKTNADSGIRFDRLWVNNSDIHISEGQLWFDKLYVEDNAHFSNDEMTAAIYGKPPLRDGSDSVYWINTEENRPESSLDMWLNGTGDWMYLRFTDDHIQESNGILLTLDEYDYVYDQRFTAENHLRWQHGRYLDEDWKQAYGYGLSLHNRYGLIDYQEFTETNAGADEVAVEA